ncbi:MAG: hypothetical protein GC154_03795 [bacterium]|nr:hypothetical protein [bacterium]
MDLLLHFTISFLLTASLIFLLLTFVPTFKHNAPRFWHSEASIRNHFIALIFLLALIYVFVIGVGKEWLDNMGFGHVEAADMGADLLGLGFAGFLMMQQVKIRYRKKRRVSFQSTLEKSAHPTINVFRHVPTQATRRKPRRQDSDGEHASFLFDQDPDD